MPAIGLYIHIPFCVAKCPYCDFYSLPFRDETADAYVQALLRAMEDHGMGELRADTVYFGGGTPNLLGARRLGALLEGAARRFGLGSDAEITLEANPGAETASLLAQLRRIGFNRVSVGVQSLAEDELSALGRIHTAEEAKTAILAADKAGFGRISADLMLAIPGQSSESLAGTLEEVARLPVGHLSAYLLKIEDNTPFGQKDTARLCPDEDTAARFYLECMSFAKGQGFSPYEISNLAKEGQECRHNLKYWRCEPYLGLGPGAHSYIAGNRFYFPRDLDAFCRARRPFDLAVADGPGGGFEEYAMLRLRLAEGLSLRETRRLYGTDPSDILARAQPLEHLGLVELKDDFLTLTPHGWLLSNAVTGRLLC